MGKPPANDEIDQTTWQSEKIENQCRPLEDALQESEETFREMLNSTHDLALLVKRDGTVLAVNTSMAERYGKNPEEFKGLNIYSLMPSEAAALRKSKAQEMLRTKLPVNYTEERIEHFFDCNLFPILNNDGSVKRFAVFVRDVTERFKCEEALRKAGKELEHRVNEKRSIGKLAAALIQDGDIVFTNSGTTTTHLIHQLLPGLHYNIFTNNLAAVMVKKKKFDKADTYLNQSLPRAKGYMVQINRVCQVGGICLAFKPVVGSTGNQELAPLVMLNIDMVKQYMSAEPLSGKGPR